MSIWKVALLWLFLVRTRADFFDLSKLLEKVIYESDTSSFYFIRIGDSFLANFMKTHPHVPVTIFESLPTHYTEDFFQRNAILVTRAIDEDKHYPQQLQGFIEQLRSRDFIIVVATDPHNLYHSLSFCFRNKFKRIFGVVNDTAFAYLPFADQPLQPLTQPDGLLPHALKDLNGFALRTTVQDNYPRCFWYPDSEGRYQIGGYAGRTLLQFFRRHNATFEEVLINNSRDKSLLGVPNATLRNDIDISMSPYFPFESLDFSNPLKVMGYCIVVPMYGYLDPHQAFYRPFTPAVWSCIGLALVYIVVMDFLKDFCVNVTPSWWRSFRRTYLFMLLNSTGVVTTSGYRFHGQVLLLSFILSNLYLAFCTSFLTAIIKVRGYDRIQDLVANKVPVVMPTFEWWLIRERGSRDLDPVAVPVDLVTYSKALRSMKNTSMAFTLDEDYARFLIHLRNRRQTLFIHIVRERVFTVYQTFLLPKHSLFRTVLNRLVGDVVASGLIQKWDHDTREQAASAGFRIEEPNELLPVLPTALRFDELMFGWICLFAGLTLATLVFLVELGIGRNVLRGHRGGCRSCRLCAKK